MKRIRRTIASILCGALFLCCTACGNTTATTSAAGSGSSGGGTSTGNSSAASNDLITLGIGAFPANFDTMERGDDKVLDLFFLPIVSYDDDGTFHMMLADSITTEDNKTYTVNLRKNATWSDGQKVTADDMLYTLNTMCDPKMASNIKSRFSVFAGVDGSGSLASSGQNSEGWSKVDDNTVKLTTDKPCEKTVVYNALTYLRPVPKHVLSDVDVTKLSTNPLFQEPKVSDGPYNFKSYQSGQYMELTANGNYCLGAPKIKKMVIKILSTSDMTAALEAGEIDANISSVSYTDYDRLAGLTNMTTEVSKLPSIGRILFLNTKTIPDAKVRQAIGYSLDRDAINRAVMSGTSIPVMGPLLSGNVFYNADIEKSVHDVKKAKQLLSDSGFKKHIVLSCDTSQETNSQMGQMIVSEMKEAGFDVELSLVDHATLLSKSRAGNFDLSIFRYGMSPSDPDISFLVRSNGSFNLGKYNNSAVDSLLDQGAGETDLNAKKKIYNKLCQTVLDDSPVSFLYGENEIFCYSKKLINFKPKSFGFFSNSYLWEIG